MFSLYYLNYLYISKSTKYIDILLLLACEKILHALTVQILAPLTSINTKQPAHSLPLLHYKLVTEHSLRIQG